VFRNLWTRSADLLLPASERSLRPADRLKSACDAQCLSKFLGAANPVKLSQESNPATAGLCPENHRFPSHTINTRNRTPMKSAVHKTACRNPSGRQLGESTQVDNPHTAGARVMSRWNPCPITTHDLGSAATNGTNPSLPCDWRSEALGTRRAVARAG